MQWTKLLNSNRRKDRDSAKNDTKPSETAGGRQEIERDYDRILFAAPTRRLADITQVFPLDKNDHVRTRLTHSHEVANLARGIGVRLAFELSDKIFKDLPDSFALHDELKSLYEYEHSHQ